MVVFDHINQGQNWEIKKQKMNEQRSNDEPTRNVNTMKRLLV